MSEPIVLARVEVREPEEGLTLTEWLAWRASEDARMVAETMALVEAALVRRLDQANGGTTMVH